MNDAFIHEKFNIMRKKINNLIQNEILLRKQIEDMKCCDNCDRLMDMVAGKYLCDECLPNYTNWKLLQKEVECE